MRKIFSLSLLSCLALGLVGCRTLVDPTFMPAGYTYHGNEYKSPPGPEADELGYEYSLALNEEILAIWRVVADDLIDQMEEQAGVGPQKIYVHDRATNAFNASYDHVVRDALQERGYVLADHPHDTLELWYEAHEPVDALQNDERSYNGDQDVDTYKTPSAYRDFVLILTLVKNNMLSGKAAGVYKLPAYGYQDDWGIHLKLDDPVMVSDDMVAQ